MSFVPISVQASLANILVATDFSPNSQVATRYAAMLARCQPNAKLCLAHVVRLDLLNPLVSEPWRTDRASPVTDPGVQLRESLAGIELPGVRVEYLVQVGELWESMEAMIAEHSVDVILVGTRGREGVEKLFGGSTAELIMRRAPCPVLVIGPRAAEEYAADGQIRQVLYATDFAIGSVHALPYALEAVNRTHAALTVLHVLEREVVTPEFEPPEFTTQAVAAARREVRDLLPPGTSAEVQIEFGLPFEAIVRIARERQAGLIVMGRRRHSPFIAAHTPWTTAHRVICDAPCPVLTVR